MRNPQRARLIRYAWHERGKARGYYLSDIPYQSLNRTERLRLTEASVNAVKQTKLVPRQGTRGSFKGAWLFFDW